MRRHFVYWWFLLRISFCKCRTTFLIMGRVGCAKRAEPCTELQDILKSQTILLFFNRKKSQFFSESCEFSCKCAISGATNCHFKEASCWWALFAAANASLLRSPSFLSLPENDLWCLMLYLLLLTPVDKGKTTASLKACSIFGVVSILWSLANE